MPFLMPVEDAVQEIMRGLKKNAFEIRFPWRLAVVMGIMRILPYRLFFALTRRMVGK
jgi:short-subunit dehydrogenase